MYTNGVYYPNWRVYRDQPPATLNYNVISHVFYAFAWYITPCINCGSAQTNIPQGEGGWHSIRMIFATLSSRAFFDICIAQR